MSETVDAHAGVVRLHGHLTMQGADLVRGTVEGLHRSGHVRLLLDLHGIDRADGEARQVLMCLRDQLAASGATLHVVERR